MKSMFLASTLCAALLCGCASPLPVGSFYTGVKMPIGATANTGQATKKGTATATSVLGLVATGDASIEAARQNGGITKIHHVDFDANNVLGIYGKYTVIVYGE